MHSQAYGHLLLFCDGTSVNADAAQVWLSISLLYLLGTDLSKLLLTAALVSLSTSLSVQEVVPPAEAGGVVADKLLVVHVVVVGASPDGQEVVQAPGEVVATVGVDSLEEAEDNPDVHGEEVQVAGDGSNENGRSDSARTEQHSLDRRSVLSGQTKRSRVSVVHLVNGLVQGTVVKAAVEPVVPGILHDEHDGDLGGHLHDRREGNTVVHAKVGRNRVEEPNLRQLGSEMAEENEGGAVPLLLEGRDLLLLNLVLVEVRDHAYDDKRNAAAKIDYFVHDKAHDTGREGVVLHVEVPSLLQALAYGRFEILLGSLDEGKHTAQRRSA